MKVLVTGKNGFIAKNLIYRLVSDEYLVESTVRSDVLSNILESFRPNIICHLAAEGRNVDEMFDTNVGILIVILDYCKNNPIHKLVVFGTACEYGHKHHPMTESDILEPDTMYGGTKAAASMLARAYAVSYKIPTVVIRPMSVYGPHEHHSRLIFRMFSHTLTHLSEGMHDWIYIDDFVNAVMNVIRYENAPLFDIVNIGLGCQRSNSDVLRIANNLMNVEVNPIRVGQSRGIATDYESMVCDPSHLLQMYKYTPTITLEEGMAKYYAWYHS